ncbi:MAG: ABC transporter substrate-binding protein [Patescibacteria group bacterium]
MNKPIKIVVSVVIALLIVGGIYSAQHTNQQAEAKPTIKIGIQLPLTGGVAMLGESSKKALELAKENIKNTKYNYELVFEDDQFKPTVGASVANKLTNVDGASVLLSFGSPVGNVVSGFAEKAKIPHINFFASDSRVADGDYNFVHYTPPYEDSKVFIAEMNRRGIKTLAFFGQYDNPGVAAIINAFEKDIVSTDIKVLTTQKFTTGTRDFRTLISNARKLNPEIYVIEGSSPEIEILTKQLRDAGVQTPVTSIEAFEFSDELSLFEGMWYVNAADPESWFLDMYKAKYNETPKFGAANGYDAVNIIVQAVESIGDGKTIPTRDEIRQALSNIKSFDGALGKNLSVDSNGQVISKAIVRMVKDGKPVTISQ